MTEFCLHRKIREWSDTKIVSIPKQTCEDFDLEEGEGVHVTIKPVKDEFEG